MKSRELSPAAPSAPARTSSIGYVDQCARWLIQHAARQAPASLSERLTEEWLADLAMRQGSFAACRRLLLGDQGDCA